jgi:hypothetical protein
MEPVPMMRNRLFVLATLARKVRRDGEHLPCDPLGFRWWRGGGKEVRDDE